ncbi:hydantoinase B/oxoprolinase family protein [Halobium salinum]|uniref:Hydantoinase B/oxoprolinase family protein n=1 Tax=Halobium salinum TaxID=1364940 RepID=A0ABD5PHY9_9EURY|nr:hydantoinase B/oxoprolinase family protein [Halobium salinum]
MPEIDPITLSVVQGSLETAQREMTTTMMHTARSSVLNIARDYSNALFDAEGQMLIQGQDIPIHLGSLMPATKAVIERFEGDVAEGDVMYHNDPAHSGSHILDCCMYKPVFVDGELRYWTVSKGHVTDIGGPVPSGYNPEATEIYAEGLRIPPVKLWEGGEVREDVRDLLLANVRSEEDWKGDLNAQYGAVNIGERHLQRLVDRYGGETVDACFDRLLDRAESAMREELETIPDGTYEGTVPLEDSGHGLGEIEITARVTVDGDEASVELESPEQVPYYINSYEANSVSGVYLGFMMLLQLDPPYNEGLYRPISVDVGEPGTVTNAETPAPHVNCTTTPSETITDAVRTALEEAVPERAVASWGHTSGVNIAGENPERGTPYTTMVLASIISGAGAAHDMDGWHSRGPLCCFGALSSGDVEIMEHMYPIVLHRYSLRPDSGGAGRQRGGCGTIWEVEPRDHEMQVIMWGEARKTETPNALGAYNTLREPKLGRVEHEGEDGEVEEYRENAILTVAPGERARNYNPGGGGVGDPTTRPVEAVAEDVKQGIVTHEGAREEYGVAVREDGSVDEAETERLRAGRGNESPEESGPVPGGER